MGEGAFHQDFNYDFEKHFMLKSINIQLRLSEYF